MKTFVRRLCCSDIDAPQDRFITRRLGERVAIGGDGRVSTLSALCSHPGWKRPMHKRRTDRKMMGFVEQEMPTVTGNPVLRTAGSNGRGRAGSTPLVRWAHEGLPVQVGGWRQLAMITSGLDWSGDPGDHRFGHGLNPWLVVAVVHFDDAGLLELLDSLKGVRSKLRLPANDCFKHLASAERTQHVFFQSLSTRPSARMRA